MAISQDDRVSDAERSEAFVGQLFMAGLGGFELLNVYLGDRLGLYRQLDGSGGVTTAGLAASAGIAERYAREWLEQQAGAGVLEVDDAGAAPGDRRYSLPAAHAEALASPDSPFSIAPLARALVSTAQALPKLLEAYRSGGGVEWSDYGADMIESQGDFNRPWLDRAVRDGDPARHRGRARAAVVRPAGTGAGRGVRGRLVGHLAGEGLPAGAPSTRSIRTSRRSGSGGGSPASRASATGFGTRSATALRSGPKGRTTSRS